MAGGSGGGTLRTRARHDLAGNHRPPGPAHSPAAATDGGAIATLVGSAQGIGTIGLPVPVSGSFPNCLAVALSDAPPPSAPRKWCQFNNDMLMSMWYHSSLTPFFLMCCSSEVSPNRSVCYFPTGNLGIHSLASAAEEFLVLPLAAAASLTCDNQIQAGNEANKLAAGTGLEPGVGGDVSALLA